MQELIKNMLRESAKLKIELSKNTGIIEEIAKIVIGVYRQGKKVLVFGNGGSAADAQHIAAELVGRFNLEREGLAALALSTNTSILTALGNDYGFERIFARQVEALGEEGDCAIGISTSGNSPNVLEAIRIAKAKGLRTIGFTGAGGGKLAGEVEVYLAVPSNDTPRIQEVHITCGHIICQLVEGEICGYET